MSIPSGRLRRLLLRNFTIVDEFVSGWFLHYFDVEIATTPANDEVKQQYTTLTSGVTVLSRRNSWRIKKKQKLLERKWRIKQKPRECKEIWVLTETACRNACSSLMVNDEIKRNEQCLMTLNKVL